MGCRETLAKRALIRVVRTPEGLRVDPTGKIPGRGAYLHDRRSCWERGSRGALGHALKVELTEPDRETLRAFMETLPQDDFAADEGSLPSEEALPQKRASQASELGQNPGPEQMESLEAGKTTDRDH